MKLRRVLIAVTGLGLLTWGARRSGLACWLQDAHDPDRQVFGGWRCVVCGLAGADLDTFNFGTGYVAPVRRTFERDGEVVSRTSHYDKSTRGGY